MVGPLGGGRRALRRSARAGGGPGRGAGARVCGARGRLRRRPGAGATGASATPLTLSCRAGCAPSLAAKLVVALARDVHAARIVRDLLVVALLGGDELVVGAGRAAIAEPVEAADDDADRDEADEDRRDQLGDRGAAFVLVLLDRLEPGQPILVGQLDLFARSRIGAPIIGVSVVAASSHLLGRGHAHDAEAVADNLPDCGGQSQRARVSSGFCARRKRLPGSSLPRFH